MFKLIAIDIDGTLLNYRSELTEKTKNILKKASEQGIYVVLTSGRLTNTVKKFCAEIGADKYLIAENGASIVNLQTNELEYSKYISKEVVNVVLDVCEANNIYYMVYTNKELIVKSIKHMTMFFYKQNYNPNARINTIIAGRDYIDNVKDNFTKLMICDEDRAIYNSIVSKLNKIPEIDVSPVPHISSKKLEIDGEKKIIEYSYADICAKGTNKWNAIKILADKLGIKDNEIMAIGDNINDIKMIENAGLGVAMGNGSPHVRALADVVAPSNDNDGVAYVVEKYVLNFEREYNLVKIK